MDHERERHFTAPLEYLDVSGVSYSRTLQQDRDTDSEDHFSLEMPSPGNLVCVRFVSKT